MKMCFFRSCAVLTGLSLVALGLCRAECQGESEAGGSAAEDEASLPAETQKSLESLVTMLRELARTLESIVDADSASQHVAAVEYLIQELYATDYAAFEGGDEEVIAAGLEDLFARIDRSMVRLDDADFYGNAELKRVFGADEGSLHQMEQGGEERGGEEQGEAASADEPPSPPESEGDASGAVEEGAPETAPEAAGTAKPEGEHASECENPPLESGEG